MCLKTRLISLDCVPFVRTCTLIVIIMKSVRDVWDRVTLRRLSSISGTFGKLTPDVSVTAFAIIPYGRNLFPESCRAGCQVAFMSAFVVSDIP